jgi:hypothetical protein
MVGLELEAFVGEPVDVCVLVGVLVIVGVLVRVAVFVGVLAIRELVAVGVDVAVPVSVGVDVSERVEVFVGVVDAKRQAVVSGLVEFCGLAGASSWKSDALLSASVQFPEEPPGRRS